MKDAAKVELANLLQKSRLIDEELNKQDKGKKDSNNTNTN